MTQTTTALNACDVAVYLDDGGGHLRDISGSSNQITANFTIESGTAGTFGSKWPIRLVCGKDASVTLVVLYTTTFAEAWDLVKDWYFTYHGVSRTFMFDVPSTTTGYDRFSGEWVLTSLDFDLPAYTADPVLVTATLLPHGEVTVAAIAS